MDRPWRALGRIGARSRRRPHRSGPGAPP